MVDASGNPVSGVRVTFTAAGSGTPPASGTFANGTITTDAFTDATGKATASAFTANWAAGSYTVTATTSGVSGGASFALTNLAGPSPTFTSVSPSALVHGTSKTLVVTGASFRPGVTVTFSNKAIGVQSVTWVSDTEIDVAVTVASNVNGNNSNITITNLDGTSASKGNVIDMS